MDANFMQMLQGAQQKIKKKKKRLDSLAVEAEAENGAVKIVINGNKKVVRIELSDAIVKEADKEHLEDVILVAINRALEKAEKLSESEMHQAAMGLIPGIM